MIQRSFGVGLTMPDDVLIFNMVFMWLKSRNAKCQKKPFSSVVTRILQECDVIMACGVDRVVKVCVSSGDVVCGYSAFDNVVADYYANKTGLCDHDTIVKVALCDPQCFEKVWISICKMVGHDGL